MEKCCAWDKARQQVEHRFLSACTLPFHGNFPSSCSTQLLQVPHITWQWRADWTAPPTNKGTEITDLSHMELSPLEPVLQCAWQRCQALNGQCSFIKSPTQLQWNWEDTSHSASSAGGEVGVGWGCVGGSSSQPPLSLCTMTNVVPAYYHKRSTKTIFPWGCTLEGSGWLLESTELVEWLVDFWLSLTPGSSLKPLGAGSWLPSPSPALPGPGFISCEGDFLQALTALCRSILVSLTGVVTISMARSFMFRPLVISSPKPAWWAKA